MISCLRAGQRSNEVCRLVDPSSLLWNNFRLPTMTDLYSWHLYFLAQSSTGQVTEKTRKGNSDQT